MTSDREKPLAPSAVIWQWQDNGPKPAAQTTSALRRRGLLQVVGAAVVATLFWTFELRTMAYIAGAIALITLAALIFSPTGALATMNRGADRLGLLLSSVIRWTFLPAVFYLFFVPFGALFRRGEKDLLKRYFEPESTSYWIVRKDRAVPASSRRNQF